MPFQWIPGEGYFANSYVYGSVLVDAGVLPMDVEPFRDAIETIVLTHCHYDHIAHVPEIAAMCDAEICIHRYDSAGLSNDSVNLSPHFGARIAPIAPHRLLSGGDSVGDLEVIHTPGHTLGSISLYNAGDQILFSGDTVFTEGGFGRVDFPGGSYSDLKHSIGILADLEVEVLCPGHGQPAMQGGAYHIKAALSIINRIHV
jgi:hydroxyacylglutathione hydrolase